MSQGRVRVREEAGDLPLEALTEDQQSAALRAFQLLQSYRELPPQPPRPSGWHHRPWVDQRRGNSVFLLDGGRGSGKTTVLLSLIYLWSKPWWPRMARDPRDEVGVRPLRDPDPVDRFREVRAEHHFVPLDIIDLRVMPDHANLLMRLASAFNRVIGQLTEVAGQKATELKCRAEWEQLARVIAYGWDANLKERRSNLDPEIYMMELAESEREGSDVQIQFRAFLESLVDDFQHYEPMLLNDAGATRQPSKRPLFIVPIDDADMNPRRAVELIELARLVWHPSVAFLLTGDSHLFMAALRAHFTGELHRSLQGIRLDPVEVTERGATRLAEEVYDRIIPPQHRCRLPELSPDKRLKLKVRRQAEEREEKGSVTAGSPVSPYALGSIEEVLAESSFDRIEPPAFPNLAEYFLHHPELCAALPARLRPLSDLRQLLRTGATMGADPLGNALDTVMLIWQRAIDASTLAGPEARAVARLVELHPSRTRIVVAAGAVEVKCRHQVIQRLKGPLESSELVLQLPVEETCTLQLENEAIELPAEVAAALKLATDVAADGHGYFVGGSPAAQLAHQTLVVFEFEHPDFGVVRWPWPQPALLSFVDYAIIVAGWKSALQSVAPEVIQNTSVRLDVWAALTLFDVMSAASKRAMPQETAPFMGEDLDRRLLEVVDTSWANAPGAANPSTRFRAAGFRRWLKQFGHTLSVREAGFYGDSRDRLRSWIDKLGAGSLAGAEEREQWRLSAMTRALSDEGQREVTPEQVHDVLLALRLGRFTSEGALQELLQNVPLRRNPAGFWGNQVGETVGLQQFLISRRRLLQKLTKDDRRTLERALEPFSEHASTAATRSGYEGAILGMWNAVTEDVLDEEVRELVSDAGGIFRVDPRGHHVDLRSVGSAPLEEDCTVQLSQVQLWQPGLTPAQQLVYRIAWDALVEEESDLVGPATQKHDLWPLVLNWFGHDFRFGWPRVRFPSMTDTELWADRWNEVVRHVAAELASADRDQDIKPVLDRLAYLYIEIVLQVAENRGEHNVEWRTTPPSPDEWKKLIQGLVRPRTRAYSGVRWRAYQGFGRDVVQLAHPAFGLSAAAARAIFGVFEPDQRRTFNFLALGPRRSDGDGDLKEFEELLYEHHPEYPRF